MLCGLALTAWARRGCRLFNVLFFFLYYNLCLLILCHVFYPRSSGLVCCSGWRQLRDECPTGIVKLAFIPSWQNVSLCVNFTYHFSPQLCVRATSPARKTRCVSGRMNAAAAMDTSEPAVTQVRFGLFYNCAVSCVFGCWCFKTNEVELLNIVSMFHLKGKLQSFPTL